MALRRSLRHAAFAAVLLAALGCAIDRPVDLGVREPELRIDPSSLRPGDLVEVTRLDGSRVRFEVVALSADGIEGDAVIVPATQIRSVTVRRYRVPGLERSAGGGRVGALVGAVLGVLIAAAVLL